VNRVVADASALVEYLLRTGSGPAVEAVLRAPGSAVMVPALCDIEVAAVLRRALRSGQLSVDRAAEALGDYADLPLTRHGHQRLLPRVLALRENFSAYDATYVALSERLDATLLTGDLSLARAAERHTELKVIAVGRDARLGRQSPGRAEIDLRVVGWGVR
jgi:predicted nucleic acid-binding protein